MFSIFFNAASVCPVAESIFAFGISAAAHALLITATVLTAIYFKEVNKERISQSLRGKGGEHE